MSEQPHPDRVRLLPWAIPPLAIDALLILIITAGAIGRRAEDGGSTEPVEYVALAIGIGTLIARRRWPMASLVVAVATTVIVVGLTEQVSAIMPITLVNLATLATVRPLRTSMIAGAATTVAFAGLVIAAVRSGVIGGESLAAIAWPAFATAAGIAIRASRMNLANIEDRARRAERTKDLEVERRVIEERLRIARDVHDVVAHHLAVVNVQSGVAGHLLRSDPEAAETALDVARGAASTAVGELGQLLSVLRDHESDVPTTPTPGLAAIDDLVSSFAGSGLRVASTTEGTPRPLSTSGEAAAYRAVQEALTNAHKHGDGSATVARRFTDDHLELTIDNPRGTKDGCTPSPATPRPPGSGTGTGTGYGLVGMRERIASAGGTLDVVDTGAHFRVHILLPTESDAAGAPGAKSGGGRSS